jgi:hypothetical protein
VGSLLRSKSESQIKTDKTDGTDVFVYDVFGHCVIAKNIRHCERSEAISTKQEQIATASPRYDVQINIDVSNLQSWRLFC